MVGWIRPGVDITQLRKTDFTKMCVVKELSTEDFHAISEWWRFGVPNVEKPTEKWFQYVTNSTNVVCICLKEQGTIKACCQADLVDDNAAICVVTNPKALRQRYATKILQQLQLTLKGRGVKRMEASVEDKNIASHLLARSFGFVSDESTNPEHGFHDYSKFVE